MPVPSNNLAAEYQSLKPEIDQAVMRVLASGNYVLGEELEAFEKRSPIIRTPRYAMGVGRARLPFTSPWRRWIWSPGTR